MLNFHGGVSFGESVGYHIVSRAINEPNRTLLNNPMDKIISNINMLSMCVVLVVLCECNRRLIIEIKCHGG
jgi:hypothetical protein